MAKKATKGSHCVRMKRTKAGMRCAVFGGGRSGGKHKRKGKGLSGTVGQCRRYKRVKIKHGRGRGKTVRRCALFVHGPGYPSTAYRKSAGIRHPASESTLRQREAAAKFGRMKKNARHYLPRAA